MTLRDLTMLMGACALCGLALTARAQEAAAPAFRPPLDFPLALSANFGELRAGHFHGGLDFKTQGETGKPVRCIADGYVGRVAVTPGGYGRAIYIVHPGGYTSVYGHVERFAPAVERALEEYQYARETFAADLAFPPDSLPCRAGDVIAWSGNEGYSFGPHLHMELRRTDTGERVDPLPFYAGRVKDTTPPRASRVVLYPVPGRGVVEGGDGKLSVPAAALGRPLEAWGELSVGVEAADRMDGTSNVYGVRSVVLFVDSAEVFRSTVDAFLPEENRMINAWADYEEHVRRGRWVMRSRRLPGNRLRMLHGADGGDGIVRVDEERDYRFRYELTDFHGNRSTLAFTVQGRPRPLPEHGEPSGGYRLGWERAGVVQLPGMELVVPRGCLYEDVTLRPGAALRDSAALSLDYRLHDAPVPLQAACTLLIGVRRMPVADPAKYYVARRSGGRTGSAGGTLEDGWMRVALRELSDATYAVAVDTVPPVITPLDRGAWKTGRVSLRVADAQTGVKDYRVEIDGRFALFAFSSKDARLRMRHPERLPRGVPHRLAVTVTDYCGNTAREEYDF